jgi:hypothetical protein
LDELNLEGRTKERKGMGEGEGKWEGDGNMRTRRARPDRGRKLNLQTARVADINSNLNRCLWFGSLGTPHKAIPVFDAKFSEITLF